MIPGWSDFQDSFHHLTAKEMEAAVGHEATDDLARMRHDGAVDDGRHSSLDRTDAEHQVLHPTAHEPTWLDSMTTWGVHAATKFAFEQVADFVLQSDFPDLALAGRESHASAATSLHVGSPHGDGFTRQTTGFTCAVVSQKMILDQFHLTDPRTGEPLSEAQLVYDATSHGWLTDHGTKLDDLNRLLDHYGVPSHVGNGWRDLIGELAVGHQVVLPVNADALWNEHSLFGDLFGFGGGSLNHALVLKGMKVDDHGQVTVVVNDPGRADGAGVEYPLDRFQAALGTTHLQFVATDHAPPGWAPAAGVHASSERSFAGHDPIDAPFVAAHASEAERYEYLRAI